ncbi:RNA methyltransferase [Candidatus Poribacteria bacterium]|nr:RNA methyltransferase [Candidatus Poribacteria bacterium]
MVNYKQVITFLDNSNSDCEWINRFKQSYQNFIRTGSWDIDYKVYTSGWKEIEGVMILLPEQEDDTDYNVILCANTERSLRELLLKFPRSCKGNFSSTKPWMIDRSKDILIYNKIKSKNGQIIQGIKQGSQGTAENRVVEKKKDTIIADIRRLSKEKERIELNQFLVEGELLVTRAFKDGLPIESIIYTSKYITSQDGITFLNKASSDNISIYNVNDGVMGSITTTRPVPTILASIHYNYAPFLLDTKQLNLQYSPNCSLLIAENIENPDNLGMTIRTADAAGVSAVLISGDGCSPFHKNCIRASRGAIGRLPLFHSSSTISAVEELIRSGWKVCGATSNTDNVYYETELSFPYAVIVGNEYTGILPETLEKCSDIIRIPMAPGQSSLNVGVAAGILLFEISRQK